MTCEAAKLIRSASRGDERAACALWHLLGPNLIRLAATIVHDQDLAHDVVQNVFIESLGVSSGEIARLRSVEGWFVWKTRQRAIDLLRSERRRINRERKSLLVRNTESVQPLTSATRDRPIKEREMLVLRHVFDMSFQEIGVALGIAPSTALARYRRAIESARSGELP